MKKAVLTDIRQMEVRDVEPPTIRHRTDVLLRLEVVGVCGSDVHYYTTGRIGDQVVAYPFAVGHEASAIVEEVGEDVKDVRPGNRVAVEPGISCHQCDQCQQGRHHTCRHLKYMGCPGQMEGCLAEKIVMPAECCYPVSDALSSDQSTLSEPLSIGVYATHLASPVRGKKVGILGVGPIGLSVMLAAKAEDTDAIYATDLLDERCQTASQHGADWTGNPSQVEVVHEITNREAGGLDIVFECCGKQEAIDQGIELLKPGGKLIILGIPQFERFNFNAHVSRRNEVLIQNVRRQNHCVRKALNLIENNSIDPSFMATHWYSLEDAKQAFDLVDAYEDGVIKAMIEIGSQ